MSAAKAVRAPMDKIGTWSPQASDISPGGAGMNKTLTGDHLMSMSAVRSRYDGRDEAPSPATPFSSYSYHASHIAGNNSHAIGNTPHARRTSPGGGGGYTPSFEALDSRLLDVSEGYRSDVAPLRSGAMRDVRQEKGYKLSFANNSTGSPLATRSLADRASPPALPPRDDMQDADVGIRLGEEGADGTIVVRAVEPGGSSEREGSIKAGDRMLMVNGLSIVGKSAEVVQWALRGYAGSSVKLMLTRPPSSDEGVGGEARVIQVDLVRGTPVYWQFQAELDFTRKELEQRKAAYELLRREYDRHKYDPSPLLSSPL